MINTVVTLLVATLKRGHTLSNMARNFVTTTLNAFTPLAKSHLSNVAIISWQIGWLF